MDGAVLDAYGWTDLKPTCEFLLDYEEDEDEDESGGGRRRKKPWRYRWPDDFRDEVLARLLELNRQLAEEERLSDAAAEDKDKTRTQKPIRARVCERVKSPSATQPLRTRQEHKNQYEHDVPASEFPPKNQPNSPKQPPNRPDPQQKLFHK